MNKITLGDTVRDRISGFSGIAIQTLQFLNGNVQIAIQPKQKEGEVSYPDAMFIDQHTVEVVEKGTLEFVPAVETEIDLGDRVRDIACGFEGVTIQKATYINGCVSFAIMPKVTKKHPLPDYYWIDHGRLERIDFGISHIAVELKGEKKAPGGPAQRVTNRQSC